MTSATAVANVSAPAVRVALTVARAWARRGVPRACPRALEKPAAIRTPSDLRLSAPPCAASGASWAAPSGRPSLSAAGDNLFAVLAAMGGSLKDVRDRALLLIGFAGGLRRSEIVALDCDDVERVRQGRLGVDLCPLVEQRLHHCEVAAPGGLYQRRVPLGPLTSAPFSSSACTAAKRPLPAAQQMF